MRLDAYMRENRLTQAALGALLSPPVSQSLVSQWFRGVTRITLEQAVQIQKLTSGLVTPEECALVHAPTSSDTAAHTKTSAAEAAQEAA